MLILFIFSKAQSLESEVQYRGGYQIIWLSLSKLEYAP